jgi:hypothetical protein
MTKGADCRGSSFIVDFPIGEKGNLPICLPILMPILIPVTNISRGESIVIVSSQKCNIFLEVAG